VYPSAGHDLTQASETKERRSVALSICSPETDLPTPLVTVLAAPSMLGLPPSPQNNDEFGELDGIDR
jgi:hypothetical protein